MVHSQMLENAFIIDNAIKKFDTIVPIIPMIGSLAKARFCNALGHPMYIISLSIHQYLMYIIIQQYNH